MGVVQKKHRDPCPDLNCHSLMSDGKKPLPHAAELLSAGAPPPFKTIILTKIGVSFYLSTSPVP